MRRGALRYDALLLTTAAIWGFAFVAQRAGMEHIGPFLFNGIRFAIGSLLLLPFALRAGRRAQAAPGRRRGRLLPGGFLAGVVLFGGASLQQGGLVYTTAGKAGFITGLYVILVPLLGFFWGERPGRSGWLGALLALGGLYLLSVSAGLSIALGDALVCAGALCWAAHVLLIGRLSQGLSATRLAAFQYAVCAVASLTLALITEEIESAAILRAGVPILYSGVLSVGIAYTLQVVAQRHAPATHAAILMSLEAVFAAIGGGLLLGERLSRRDLAGCALMLAGMLVSQLARAPRAEAEPAQPGPAGSRPAGTGQTGSGPAGA